MKRNKRIIGILVVKNNKVVQTKSFKEYLPLGNIEYFIENLQRWSIDEIAILDISRSINKAGPNFELIKKISNLKINTPLIYGGNIRNSSDAIHMIKCGADRIIIGNSFLKNKNIINETSNSIGSQALILSMPILKKKNNLYIYNYVEREMINYKNFCDNFSKNISEIFITDVLSDGNFNSFDENIIKIINTKNIPIIAFGGISESSQIKRILINSKISAIGIGNFLSYKEHALQKLIEKIKINSIRKPKYK
jgi:cyclase